MKRLQLRPVAILLGGMMLVASCAKDRGPRSYPGALTKPIDSYTGDEFLALVKKLDYVGGHDRDRNCKGDPGCGSSKKVVVRVDAVATQDSISGATAPQFGAVYMHAENKGDADEARYGMKPARGGFDYYVIINADSSGKAMTWRLEEFDTKAKTHHSIGTGPFKECNHPWHAGASADFKSCAYSKAQHDSVVKLDLTMQLDTDPFWMSCAQGCCVGGG